jgi:hypothetical protein
MNCILSHEHEDRAVRAKTPSAFPRKDLNTPAIDNRSRNDRDLQILNANATRLNAEAADALDYQSPILIHVHPCPFAANDDLLAHRTNDNSVLDAPPTPRPWLWPNLLSLDAPIVAVLWQLLFARCFHAGLSATAAILLVLAVWLIYAADRVLDARDETSRQPRHEFYRRHWRAVLPMWTAILLLSGWLAWTRLPSPMFERGLLLLIAVALYLMAVHVSRRPWPKEAAVAILFALGASLAIWGNIHSVADVATIFLFCCLCWINCVAISQWEHGNASRWPIGAAALSVAAASLILVPEHRPVLGAAEAASALAFLALDRGRRHLSADAVRVLADAALLTPIFFLPVAGSLS